MKNQRLGMTFKTKNGNQYFYDSGTGKVVLCNQEKIEFIEQILINQKTLKQLIDENIELKDFIKQENLFQYPEEIPFTIPRYKELKKDIIGNCN